MPRPSLNHRIALLVDGPEVSGFVHDLLGWLDQQPDIHVCALIIHPAPQSEERGLRKFAGIARRNGLYTSVSRTAFALLSRIEARVTGVRQPRFDIGGRVSRHLLLRPQVSKSGAVYRFSEEQVRQVRDLGADLLIRCGNGILRGDILAAAKHGILSMHHGDNRVNRGGPAGFWEVLNREPGSGFIVQRLTEQLDGGVVLCRGNIATDWLYSRNQQALLDRSLPYLTRTIRQVLDGTAKAEPPFVYAGRIYRTPLLHQSLLYAARTLALAGKKALRRAPPWRVAYGFGAGPILTLPNPRGHFLADPFAFRHQGRSFIFTEDCDLATGKGTIVVYQVSPSGHRRLGTALEEPFHLSFPFLFRYQDDIYMVPESRQAAQIRLYRAVDFPLKWELAAILKADVRAADTLVFEKDGRWWLLTTLSSCGACDAELHLFHSDNPLKGWEPHPQNPVIFDPRNGRCGGLLRQSGHIYRVAQERRFAEYGTGCALYRIDELSQDAFNETRIEGWSLAGHHLHRDGDLAVFDYRVSRPGQIPEAPIPYP